jgi:hypothetical protein
VNGRRRYREKVWTEYIRLLDNEMWPSETRLLAQLETFYSKLSSSFRSSLSTHHFRQYMPAAVTFASCKVVSTSLLILRFRGAERNSVGTIRAGYAFASVVWTVSEVSDI